MLKALADFFILIGFIGGGFIGVKLYKQVDSSYDPNRIESYAKAFVIGGLIVASIFLVLGEFLKNFIVPLVIILLVIGIVLHFSNQTETSETETADNNSEQNLREENIQMQNEVDVNNVASKLNSAVSNQSLAEKIPVQKVSLKKNNLLPKPQETISQENSVQTVNQFAGETVPVEKVNLKKNNLLPKPQETILQENSVQTVNQIINQPATAPEKKFCAYCGAKLHPNSKFCGSCGKPTDR